MEVAINRQRQLASVRVSKEGWESADRERLIVHELLHIVFDPIREQHEFALDVWRPHGRKVYDEKHLTEVEKAVEHLSYVLYDA